MPAIKLKLKMSLPPRVSERDSARTCADFDIARYLLRRRVYLRNRSVNRVGDKSAASVVADNYSVRSFARLNRRYHFISRRIYHRRGVVGILFRAFVADINEASGAAKT